MDYLSIREAARLTGRTETSIYRASHRGVIVSRRLEDAERPVGQRVRLVVAVKDGDLVRASQA